MSDATQSRTSPLNTLTHRGRRRLASLPPGAASGFIVAVIAVLAIALFAYLAMRSNAAADARVLQTLEVLDRLQTLLARVKDAETGQRGFLLTGDERYLEPYVNAQAALTGELAQARDLLAGSAEQRQRLDALAEAEAQKMAELGETIDLRRKGDVDGALAIVRTDRGKAVMDRIRALLAEMAQAERGALSVQQAEADAAAARTSQVTGLGSLVLLVLIVSAGVMTSRTFHAREAEVWLRSGQAGLSERIQGELRLETLGDRVLSFLAEYLDAQVGVAFVVESDGSIRRLAAYAEAPGDRRSTLQPGDGLPGQAVKERRALHVTDVPDGHIAVSSAVGRSAPRELLVMPAIADDEVLGVIELGFFRRLSTVELDLGTRVSHLLGVAIRTARDRARLEELLAETQLQAEQMQTQQEELRVSNEELEEQSRILKDSQARLESQQA